MMKKFFFTGLMVIILSSCYDKANISIQNKVHNATLEQVSWDNHSVASSLLPGEGNTITVHEGYEYHFPRKSVVKFYMKRGDKQVYLETKYAFTLDVDDNLLIVISDTTQVINPALSN